MTNRISVKFIRSTRASATVLVPPNSAQSETAVFIELVEINGNQKLDRGNISTKSFIVFTTGYYRFIIKLVRYIYVLYKTSELHYAKCSLITKGMRIWEDLCKLDNFLTSHYYLLAFQKRQKTVCIRLFVKLGKDKSFLIINWNPN